MAKKKATKKEKQKKLTHVMLDYNNHDVVEIFDDKVKAAITKYLNIKGLTEDDDLNDFNNSVELYKVSKKIKVEAIPRGIDVILEEE